MSLDHILPKIEGLKKNNLPENLQGVRYTTIKKEKKHF